MQIVRKKSQHGTVAVHSSRGRLRLVFTYRDERRYVYLSLPDTVPARGLAEMVARRIESDIYADNFDETLNRYRPEKLKRSGLTVAELFQRFINFKEAQGLTKTTLVRYRALLSWITKSPISAVKIESLNDRHTLQFERVLKNGDLAPAQRRRRIEEMKSCWTWAQQEGLVDGESNPWSNAQRAIKVPPRQAPKPFTADEAQKIIKQFKPEHYRDFVEFLFLTGCRTSEACGLRWRHLSDECDRAWVGEMLVRRVQRPAKNLKAREVPLSDRVKQLLLTRKPSQPDPDDLIFFATEGGQFLTMVSVSGTGSQRLRTWGLPIGVFYLTRSTFVCHALAAGLAPSDVAKLTGHSIKTLFERYASHIPNNVKLPDIFGSKA